MTRSKPEGGGIVGQKVGVFCWLWDVWGVSTTTFTVLFLVLTDPKSCPS